MIRRKPEDILQALYEEHCCNCTTDDESDDDDLFDGDKLVAKYLQMRGEFNERVKQTMAASRAVKVFKRTYTRHHNGK